jgi:hypothetical protein
MAQELDTLIAELREFFAFAERPEPDSSDLMVAHVGGALSRVEDIGVAACAINGRTVFVPSEAEQACRAELANAKMYAEFMDRRPRADAELRLEMIGECYARYTRAWTGIVTAGSDATKGLAAIAMGGGSRGENGVTFAHLNLLCTRCDEFHLVVHSLGAVLENSLFWEMEWVRQLDKEAEAPAPRSVAPAPAPRSVAPVHVGQPPGDLRREEAVAPAQSQRVEPVKPRARSSHGGPPIWLVALIVGGFILWALYAFQAGISATGEHF